MNAGFGTKPVVSVLLPVHNAESYLRESLDSILAQSFHDFEVIAIDDGSTDNSLRTLKEYGARDSRIRLYSREQRGLVTTLNEGIDLSRSEWIARMDADDICLPDRLARQYQFLLDHPEAVVVGSAAHFIDMEGKPVCTYCPPTEDAILRRRFPGSPFIHPTVMFRKDACLRAGRYPETMRWGGEDVVFFARMARLGTLHNLDIPLLNYRLVPGSMSRKPPEFRKRLVACIKKEMAGVPVTAAELNALRQAAERIDKSQAEFDYHFELAKLCVWSGRGAKAASPYLEKAAELKPFNLRVLIVRLLALLPGRWVQWLYSSTKKRRFT